MGASQSTGIDGLHRTATAMAPHVKSIYALAMDHARKSGAVTGGGDSGKFFGGAKDADPYLELREYSRSLAAASKEKVIRAMANAMFKAGVKDINVDEPDLDKLVANLNAKLPAPGSNIKSDMQAKVCLGIAQALNKVFTPGATKPGDMLIDTSLSPNRICNMVSEMAKSYTAGVHNEFLDVQASVTRKLNSMQILGEVMEKLHGEISARIAKSSDSTIESDVSPLDEMYRRAQQEHKRQMALLSNLLNITLAPAKDELARALRDDSEENKQLTALGLTVGSAGFGHSIINSISAIGVAAATAARVHKALKEVGQSVEDYLNSKSFKDFEAMTDKKLLEGGVKKPDEFLKAVQTLRAAFGKRSEFKDELKNDGKSGGGEPKTGGAFGSDSDITVDATVEKTKAAKKLIIQNFARKVHAAYDDIVVAIKGLASMLGKQIPLTDRSAALRDAISRMQSLRDTTDSSIEVALIGGYNDVGAREKKERFLSSLTMVSNAVAGMLELDANKGAAPQLTALKNSIGNLIKIINTFADMFTRTYGGAEDKDGADDGAPVTGGADPDYLPEINASVVSLKEATGIFNHAYFTAAIRQNIAGASADLETYGAKYMELLGQAVAARQQVLADELKTRNTAAETKFAADETKKAAVLKEIKLEYDIKNRFYNMLQALDLYMKAFTEGIVSNPDAVMDIKRLVDAAPVISRWFNEATGDAIWRAFECTATQSSVTAGGARSASGLAANTEAGHYYKKVSTLTDVSTPGGGMTAGTTDVRKYIKGAMSEFQALKNLTNMFVRIADKFGDGTLAEKTFLSPAQIYKTLVDYMEISAVETTVDVINRNGVNAREGDTYFGMIGETRYKTEDMYFVMAIKAMAAKVLTAVGVFDMFKRDTPLYALSPVRMIIGGGPDDVPEILDGATELYFRLPRLVEYYRRLLDPFGAITPGVNTAARRISMVPEIEGIFSGIVRLIFVKSSSVDSADYSSSENATIVREVNAIYTHFKSAAADKPIMAALMAFIKEINRRYGVVVGSELDKYKAMITEERKGAYGTVNQTNYAILPGEEDVEDERRAPSAQYIAPGVGPAVKKTDRLGVDLTGASADGAVMLVNTFHKAILNSFKKVKNEEFGTFTYRGVIDQATAELARARDKEARFNIVTKLIQGTSVVSLDAGKSFMFHETVVVGLNTLAAVQALLDRFNRSLDGVDVEAISAKIGKVLDESADAKAMVAARTAAEIESSILDSLSEEMKLVVRSGANHAAMYAAIKRSVDVQRGIAPLAPAAWTSAKATFTRDLVNWSNAFADKGPSAMRRLLENIFNFTSKTQGLVELRIGNSDSVPIHFEWGKLRNMVESTIADIKTFFDLLRPFISKELVDRYESSSNQGSVYWIEKNLLDRFVRPREMKVDPASPSLDNIGTKANRIFLHMVTTPIPGSTVVEPYGDEIATMIWYNSSRVQADGAAVELNANLPVLSAFVATKRTGSGALNRPLSGLPDPARAGAMMEATHQTPIYNEDVGFRHDQFSSLMFLYNQLIAKYILRLSDPAGGVKIYANLINSFVNGPASQAVARPSSGFTFPDLIVSGFGFGARGDPAAGAVLCTSLAYILARLSRDVDDRTRLSDHLVTTLTDVPPYVKEAMRADLPIFIRLFDTLSAKCDFVRSIIQKTKIDLRRSAGPDRKDSTGMVDIKIAAGARITAFNGAAAAATANHWSKESINGVRPIDVAPVAGSEMRARFVAALEAINTGSYALASSSQEVLREMHDTPVYLQTQENGIEIYKSRNGGKMPLMPLSLTLYSLSDDGGKIFTPDYTLGTPEFKFQYGTRGVLIGQGTVSLDSMPGVKAALEAFNGASAARERIDGAKYTAFVQRTISLLRWIADCRFFRAQNTLPVAEKFSVKPLTSTETGLTANVRGFAVNQPALEVIEIVESSDQDGSIKKIANDAVAKGSVVTIDSRERECALNLIDINVIPINIHALQRTVPLVNLINYAFTADLLTADTLGLPADKKVPPTNSREMFASLLTDPLMAVTDEQFGGYPVNNGDFVARLFRGDSSFGLERPKMLSDQIYNKALFGSLYPRSSFFDPAGPEVGAGIARGANAGRLRDQVDPIIALLSDVKTDTVDTKLADSAWAQRIDSKLNTYEKLSAKINQLAAELRFIVDTATLEGASKRYAAIVHDLRKWSPVAIKEAKEAAAGGTDVHNAHGAHDLLVPAMLVEFAKIKTALNDSYDRDSDSNKTDIVSGTGLTYIDSSSGNASKVQTVPVKARAVLEKIGKQRFDTTFIRKIMFVVNVLRLTRMKLAKTLSQSHSVIRSSHAAISPALTEFGFGDRSDPNETFGSQKFNDS